MPSPPRCGPAAERARRRGLRSAALAAALLALLATSPAAAQPPDTAAADTAAADTAAAAPDSTSFERAAANLATQAEATPETLSIEPTPAIPVFLGGKEVFRVRSSRDGLAPEQRAAAIRNRLSAAVRRREIPADSVRVVSTPDGIEIRFADQFLWLITPGDVDASSPTALAAAVAEIPSRVRDGILKERAGRRPIGILVSALLAMLITVAAWIVLRLLLALNRRWRAWLDRALPGHLHGLRIRGFEVMSKPQMTGLVGSVLGRLDLVAGALLIYAYITLVLSLFPWTQGWSWHLFHFAASRLGELAAAVGAAIPGLVMVVIIFFLFRWLTALSDRFFDAVDAGTLTVGMHPELAKPSKRLVKILLWIVAAIVAYPYIPGAQSKAVQGVSLLVGIMVSLGSTGFVGNIIAGIVLTYSRSFRVGDRVKIGDQSGDVTSLGFFATKLRSIRNEEVTLPNGMVALQPIVNYTRLAESDGLILHTEVTIGYDVDWRTVHGLLIEAALRVAGVEPEPKPWVFQRSLNDYHVGYEINCVTRLSHPQLRLYSDLHQEIQDAFARAGIEILSPAFHALRDANAAVLPREPDGPRPAPGGFRMLPRDP